MAKKSGEMETLVTLGELNKAYGGKKVFITGHTGFKGAWLMAILHQAGARVKGYALAPDHEEGLFNILYPLPEVESCIADIRDKQRLRAELQVFRPDYVFHLAAQPLVRRSYEIPAETFDVNVTGTANVLEAVMALDTPCTVVAITTDKVYENKETGVLYKESDALGGHDPYSASKACAELVVASFRNCFFAAGKGSGLASARAGNVIGGGDWSRDRIIPDLIRALVAGRPVEVRNPASVRPWQHVLEPLGGYLRLGALLHTDAKRYSQPYNFGPLAEDHLSVKELVETAIDTWGQGSWTDASTPNAPHEAGLLRLDIRKAGEQLKWVPRLDARQAIQWTVEWCRQPAANRREYSFQQIKSYFPA
jgi:CDP-glucose 4,6-dehydratase